MKLNKPTYRNELKIFSFTEALAAAEGKHRLLIGNGFSQACRKNIFSYGSLLEKANLSELMPSAKIAFEKLKTENFEVVIKSLKEASSLVKLYSNDQKASIDMKNDSDKLKEILVDTIAKNHPLDPNDLEESEFIFCRNFLRNFDAIYTTNYDLLLYWSLMHEDSETAKEMKIKCDDGFRHSEDQETSDYVTWEIENSDGQNIFYLHGALHLFESDTELQKYTWSRTGIKLIDQIRAALTNDYYPVIVAEGTSSQKMSRTMKSAYLQRGLKSLASCTGSLFIFGMALHENDNHILKSIRKGKVSQLWVGIYGDPNLKENKDLILRAKNLASDRSTKRPLEVNFFNSESVQVWR